MKFTVAAVALAAGAQAAYQASNVTYTTEVVTAYTTYCPAATEITYGGKTYSVTEATTLTITDCPCTVSKPVYTTSAVVCNTCTSSAPAYPTAYANSTVPAIKSTGASSPSTTAKTSPSSSPSTPAIPTAGAGKVAALSGAALAGLVGVAALL